MTLHDVGIYGEPGHFQISLDQGKISSISKGTVAEDEFHIELEGALCLPGLINSHDHLDFNLFPTLGNRTYRSYTEWGPHIREAYPDIINKIQAVPLSTRVAWGIYKNLLNGFTTVVNHGAKLPVNDAPIHVYQESQSLHSPAFEKEWKWKINNPLRIRQPVVMHVGEGTDNEASLEIGQVTRINRIGRQLVGVHGVAMDPEQAEKFYGLVWCPASNYFLLGRTADTRILKRHTKVVFGTDSTLTSPWNCWDHFRLALDPGDVTEHELLNMLTRIPAGLWGMNDRGTLEPGKKADLVVLKNKSPLFSQDPADILLVIQAGEIRLADATLQLPGTVTAGRFSLIRLNDSMKWIRGDMKRLVEEIRRYYPSFQPPFRHAG